MTWAASTPWAMAAWKLSGTQAGLIQSTFNLAYAVSLWGSAWAADRLGPGRVFNVANGLAALAFCLCAGLARSFPSALILFGLLGLMLGGSYAPSLMLAARGAPAGRGTAVGWTLAGASVGYFIVIAITAVAAPSLGLVKTWFLLVAAPCLAALIGLLATRNPSVAAAARLPPNGPPGGREHSYVNRTSLLLTGGYAFHCWELLGMWAWAPAFLTVMLGRHGIEPAAIGLLTAGALHLAGATSTLLAGSASDRLGRRAVLIMVAVGGAACSLTFGWLGSLGAVTLVFAAALYGFSALADSGVLSAAMADAVPSHVLGRTLALRSLVGFGAGALAPVAFGVVLDLTNPHPGEIETWGWAFMLLGMGGVGAAACAWALPRDVADT